MLVGRECKARLHGQEQVLLVALAGMHRAVQHSGGAAQVGRWLFGGWWGLQRLHKRLGWRLSGCAGLHRGLVAVWWLRRWLSKAAQEAEGGGCVGGCWV